MRIINTRTDSLDHLSFDEQEWTYNGLDACITKEVDEKSELELNPNTSAVLEFTFRQVRPALAMMLRGVAVNAIEREKLTLEVQAELADAEGWLNEMGEATWGKPINPRSPAQLRSFFYDYMKITPVIIRQKGEKKISTNRESLEKIYNENYHPRPFINAIFAAREAGKILSVLRYKIEHGRFRASFNPAGTNSGRWSSSDSAFGTGANLQNITNDLRRLFIADRGKILGYTDLEQAESRGVAYYSGDQNYIDACLSENVHVFCCRLMWPGLLWTGDFTKDKKIAKAPYYRQFSYYDMMKRGGHAFNYMATPWTVARALKIDQNVAEDFQSLYFSTFPGISAWHKAIARELWTTRKLTTDLGRERLFFGRPNDDAELRKAIAWKPQSTVADILNTGLCEVWEAYDNFPQQLWRRVGHTRIEVLIQVHDAIVYQFDENDLEAVSLVESKLVRPVTINGQLMTIPVETKIGYDWQHMVLPSQREQLKRLDYSLLQRG